MSDSLSGKTLLSRAASVLKSMGSNALMNEQIDAVANIFTGTKRAREFSVSEGQLPPEANNVLEVIKIQINKAFETLASKEYNESTYNQFVEDLEVIESFAERMMKFYQPQGEDFFKSVQNSFSKAKSEAITTLALEKMVQKIDLTEKTYRSNPKMTGSEYRENLEDLSSKVKSFEKELLADDKTLKNSQTILERVNKLRNKLNEAAALSDLEDHPVTVGQKGLDILRKASEMIQQAKSQREVEQATALALDANKNLVQGGETFQERGRNFNLQIMQMIVAFVNKQIKKLEKELLEPLDVLQADFEKNEETADRLINQMEQLLSCFGFVKKWGGPHQEDLLERIALIYEKIEARAVKGRIIIAQEVSLKNITEEKALQLGKLALKYQKAETLASDVIKPSEIFHEKKDINFLEAK